MLFMLCFPGLNVGQVPKTRASIASFAFTSVAAITLMVLSHLEHTRSSRPSTILTLYFFTSTVLDAIRARTIWIISESLPFSIFFTINVSFRAVIFALEILEKTSNFKKLYKEIPRESTVNVFNRNLFWWLNPLLGTGFRRVLEVETLIPIDERLNSPYARQKLFARWSAGNDILRRIS